MSIDDADLLESLLHQLVAYHIHQHLRVIYLGRKVIGVQVQIRRPNHGRHGLVQLLLDSCSLEINDDLPSTFGEHSIVFAFLLLLQLVLLLVLDLGEYLLDVVPVEVLQILAAPGKLGEGQLQDALGMVQLVGYTNLDIYEVGLPLFLVTLDMALSSWC